jgi:hypothetical protein
MIPLKAIDAPILGINPPEVNPWSKFCSTIPWFQSPKRGRFMRFGRTMILILALSVTVFGAHAVEPEKPNLRQRCGNALLTVVEKCQDISNECAMRFFAWNLYANEKVANVIEKTLDRLPPNVAQSVRHLSSEFLNEMQTHQMMVSEDFLTRRRGHLLGELVMSLGSYRGDFRTYYNMAAINAYSEYSPVISDNRFMVGIDSASRKQLEKVDAMLRDSLPAWKQNEETWAIATDQNISLYSDKGVLPKLYPRRSIIIMQGMRVLGEVTNISEPVFKPIE